MTSLICLVIVWVATEIILNDINRRADTLEILLDGIIDRLNKLEKK